MEALIFIGLPGAGKSSFYQKHFSPTHTRINLDTLGTRTRERKALEGCIAAKADFVVDNTNPTVAQRAPYIARAKEAGYTVKAYYFDTPVEDCLDRNARRTGKERVHPVAVYAARKRMQPPSLSEGFDAILVVRVAAEGKFEIIPASSHYPA